MGVFVFAKSTMRVGALLVAAAAMASVMCVCVLGVTHVNPCGGVWEEGLKGSCGGSQRLVGDMLGVPAGEGLSLQWVRVRRLC